MRIIMRDYLHTNYNEIKNRKMADKNIIWVRSLKLWWEKMMARLFLDIVMENLPLRRSGRLANGWVGVHTGNRSKNMELLEKVLQKNFTSGVPRATRNPLLECRSDTFSHRMWIRRIACWLTSTDFQYSRDL